MSNLTIFLPFITYIRFICMLIEVSSRICFNHVPNVSRMLVKFMVKCFNIYNVVIVVFGSDLCFCILKSVQQISACVSNWQSHSH